MTGWDDSKWARLTGLARQGGTLELEPAKKAEHAPACWLSAWRILEAKGELVGLVRLLEQ